MSAPQAPHLLRLARPAALVLASICALRPMVARAESAPPAPPPTIVVPFAVDEPTARWVRSTVPARVPPLDRLRRLSRALLDPIRGIAEGAHTSTAADVFAERRANCVGYANLFVALARELGVAAYFVLVDGLPGSGGSLNDESLTV
ncbi:MAG TPA: transglutaminase domain-containing protein, partial [Thermoanaerobaculia bacterium]|nr:transglutaminase domain-containing protein [Thermoanaerobaculia bacterium]